MPITVTTAELKAHLRLNDASEDALLGGFLDAAEIMFANLTGRTLDTHVDTGFPTGFPEPVKLAVRLLAAHFYEHRTAFADEPNDAMPFGFLSVCRQYALKYVSPGAIG